MAGSGAGDCAAAFDATTPDAIVPNAKRKATA
jgi:hypothetical protein